jgi:hypothetical protein
MGETETGEEGNGRTGETEIPKALREFRSRRFLVSMKAPSQLG